jgi:hypothetical protein
LLGRARVNPCSTRYGGNACFILLFFLCPTHLLLLRALATEGARPRPCGLTLFLRAHTPTNIYFDVFLSLFLFLRRL